MNVLRNITNQSIINAIKRRQNPAYSTIFVPHFKQIKALGGIKSPQFKQYLLPIENRVPHDKHSSSLSFTSFPQFRQYINYLNYTLIS
jgi:hypothetical protein